MRYVGKYEQMSMQLTWRALADPVRREILDLLREEERTTGEICDAFNHLTRFGVLSHMTVLKQAGLVHVERRGRERINRIDPEPLREAYEEWIRNYEVLWAGRLGRLKKLVEQKDAKAAMTDDALPVANLVTLNLEQEIDLKASPAEVFRAVTLDIGEWWGQPHLRDDAWDIVLDPVPGGLVKQVTRDGGGSVMFMVQAVRRDRLLVLHGSMGIPKTIHMTVQFEFEPMKGGRTRLRLKHWAIGEFTSAFRDGFTKGWQDLLDSRLRAYVETGKSLGIRAK
jgi:DNA-binding transcriptional ArsR family regulator/uncharacterized protein YndB with AHSA1/START domain